MTWHDIHQMYQGNELVPCDREGPQGKTSTAGVQEPLGRAVVSLGRKNLQEMRALFAASGVSAPLSCNACVSRLMRVVEVLRPSQNLNVMRSFKIF